MKVLLHACCAPCSSAIVEYLVDHGYECSIFYSNPNIYPSEEYQKRLGECVRYAAKWDVPIIEDVYDHESWRECVSGLENEPERGARCAKCFEYRLLRAAKYASEHGFPLLTTTLASSRWKSLKQINEAGAAACSMVNGVEWWDRNWRKGGLQERRQQIIREENFYNQLYCGCEFSMGRLADSGEKA